MGNKPSFRVNCYVKGQGPDALTTFDSLGLGQREVNHFWREFIAIDKKNTGEITIEKFHHRYGNAHM
jgi:hypothetical protein